MRRRLVALTLTLVVVLPLSAVAARWQWSRHIERDARNAQIVSAAAAPIVQYPGPLADGYQDVDRYRRVSVHGAFVWDEQQLVRKSVLNGTVGYDVMTPFLTDNGTRLYVVRGWSATASPDPSAVSTVPMNVVLRIDAIVPNGEFRPADLPAGEINWIDPKALAAGRPYAPAIFDLVSPTDPTLAAIPEPETSSGPHLSYTFQWILIGLTAVVVYVRVMRREFQDSREN